jgi:hypothetical protein
LVEAVEVGRRDVRVQTAAAAATTAAGCGAGRGRNRSEELGVALVEAAWRVCCRHPGGGEEWDVTASSVRLTRFLELFEVM